MLIEREIITVDGMRVYDKFTKDIDNVENIVLSNEYLKCYSKNEPWFDEILINTKYIVSLRPL
jgi:hypothetical protein